MRNREWFGLTVSSAKMVLTAILMALLLPTLAAAATEIPAICQNETRDGEVIENGMVVANVVALDQPIWNNRLGASMPSGMIFALERDVCVIDTNGGCKSSTSLELPLSAAGNVMLKPYKRPRPITMRVNRGQCLRVQFKNLLSKTKNTSKNKGDPKNGLAPLDDGNLGSQQDTRRAGVHIQGMEWVTPLDSQGTNTTCADGSTSASCNDASWVGDNPSSLADPGQALTYTVYAAHEGTFVMVSAGDDWTGAHGDGGTMPQGLFGAVHVQPGEAEYYRSQVTNKDLEQANNGMSDFGQPLIDYFATYKDSGKVRTTSAACFESGTCRVGPVLSMLCTQQAASNGLCQRESSSAGPVAELVHSDLTAIMTGRGAGRFDGDLQEPRILDAASDREILGRNVESGTLGSSYALPDRLQPYREITIMYHDAFITSQAFASLYKLAGQGTPETAFEGALVPGGDYFGLNYGMGGIGSEILANRFELGPMGDCTACKYEEFFLTSWAVGDPAMVVDKTADSACMTTPDQSETQKPGVTWTKITDDDNGKPLYYVCKPGSSNATVAYYPDDPSNVYHSYLSDHTKFRIAHGAADLHHLHHQHAHQWMHSPDTSNGDYTDSQSIGPGSAFTLEMVYNGSGNVNQTVGDSIFHCHFYPHFAAGMWSMWRVHDVYETGTGLEDCDDYPNCTPQKVARALPDAEIPRGTPIPAVVPMPTLAMPPMPANVRLNPFTFDGGVEAQVVEVQAEDGSWIPAVESREASKKKGLRATSAGIKNPGFPFFIPGVAGQRAPHPPLDFAYVCAANAPANAGKGCVPNFEFGEKRLIPQMPDDSCAKICGAPDHYTALDGGLTRHVILGSNTPDKDDPNKNTKVFIPTPNATDYSKILERVHWQPYPDDGTIIERVAMRAHAERMRDSVTPTNETMVVNGYDPTGPKVAAKYLYNGLPPVHGAPYADPCIQYSREGGHLAPLITRQYLAADIQIDATFNKEGWHYPQQRMITLWGDVQDTMSGERPPEPFFFRSNSEECIDYTLANLVPNLYELDDFQVRTPTDILGQHIHLVKFDVTSSDGATNGFNYEDGTLAPNEVTERIQAINAMYKAQGKPESLEAKYLPFFGPGPGGQWMGAQATIQRWWADPLLNQVYKNEEPIGNPGVDRTLRTVFTHDHFGPSTHQQAGLYAGLVIEPHGSDWLCNDKSGFCGDAFGKPFGGAKVGNLENNGTPFGNPGPGRPVEPWDYGSAFNGAPPAVPINDGGPTSWQAVIEPPQKVGTPAYSGGESVKCALVMPSARKRCIVTSNGSKVPAGFCQTDSDCTGLGYREFLFEFQDSTLTYEAFNDLPNVDKGGYCSSSNTSCTPATATLPAKGCGAGEVCYAYGFCSTNFAKTCRLATWEEEEDISNCPPPPKGPPVGSQQATCNLVAGIPSFNLNNCIGNQCYVSRASCQTASDCEFIAGWDTGAISNTNQPELITLQNATFNFSVNYRNEPLFPRLNDTKLQVLAGDAGDSASVYRSIPRPGSLVENGQPPSYPPLTSGVEANDPFTPLLRAYPGDDVQVRTLVGAHINPHNFTFQGISWLMEPSFVDSGWRNSQVMGISEHFEMLFKVPSSVGESGEADYLYMPGAAAIEQAAGSWGLMRVYGEEQNDLQTLAQNQKPKPTTGAVCTPGNDDPHYDVVVTTAKNAFQDFPNKQKERGLYYTPIADGPAQQKPGAWDPNAVLYFDAKNCEGFPGDCTIPFNPDEVVEGQLATQYWQSKGPAPLVLRAPAGSCMTVTLHNYLEVGKDTDAKKLCIQSGSLKGIDYIGSRSPTLFGDDVFSRSNAWSCTSPNVGLHPQLVSFNTTESNAFNVGKNPVQTVAPGGQRTYTWYAGNIDPTTGEKIPVELGVANLIAADALNHWQHALYGGLVVEPQHWNWAEWRASDVPQGVSTVITTDPPAGFAQQAQTFREHVVLTADGLVLENIQQFPSATRVSLDQNISLDSINFHSPVFDAGLGSNPYRLCETVNGNPDLSCVMTDPSQGGLKPSVYPKIFEACAGEQVRFHFLHPGGINTNNTMEIFGHVWSEAPYESVRGPAGMDGCTPSTSHTNLYASGILGDGHNCLGIGAKLVQDNDLSLNEWQGSHMGHGPQNHMTFLLDSAGGTDAAPGDYLIRSYPAMHYRLGMWGIFRVNKDDAKMCKDVWVARSERETDSEAVASEAVASEDDAKDPATLATSDDPASR